ncbi:MAG: hypothetical protein WCG95_02380, partial [bacterium]
FNAVNAFKSSGQIQDNQMPEVSDGIQINDNNILKNQNIDEIKQVAQNVGESNLSNEDIQYGITYGRSVIADYMI